MTGHKMHGSADSHVLEQYGASILILVSQLCWCTIPVSVNQAIYPVSVPLF